MLGINAINRSLVGAWGSMESHDNQVDVYSPERWETDWSSVLNLGGFFAGFLQNYVWLCSCPLCVLRPCFLETSLGRCTYLLCVWKTT